MTSRGHLCSLLCVYVNVCVCRGRIGDEEERRAATTGGGAARPACGQTRAPTIPHFARVREMDTVWQQRAWHTTPFSRLALGVYGLDFWEPLCACSRLTAADSLA
jgi:hypothetical protein